MTTSTTPTVVVGVDGTADGERATWYGVDVATREDLDLRLVHVPHEIAGSPMMPYLPPSTMLEIGDRVLREAAKQAEEAGYDEDRISTVLATGSRSQALLGELQDAHCVVLGTRASTVQHLLTGATSLSLAARSPVPVHCVPRSWGARRSPSGRLVVGVDGSAADGDVLPKAFREAGARGATLEIVHAWHPTSPYDAGLMGVALRDDWDEVTRGTLTRRIEPVAATHPGVAWTLRLEFERVTVALHEAAVNADLLILGRHSHNPLTNLVTGSNTRTLVRSATCPVVVVPVHNDSP